MKECDITKLRSQLSSARLHQFDVMTYQSNIYLSSIEFCLRIDPSVEMFYLMDFLRDLIINGIKMTFDLVKKVLNQLHPEQFNESLMRAVKEFM